MKRQILVRLLLGVLTLQIIGLALLDTASLSNTLVLLGGAPALASMAALALLSITAIADTVVNDVLPARYRLGFAFRRRHLVWACMGVTYGGYAFVLARLHIGPWMAGIYVTLAVACLAVAFMDLRYRAQESP